MDKEQDYTYSPYIPGSEYYNPERRSEIREGARKLRKQYLRYKEAEIIYSIGVFTYRMPSDRRKSRLQRRSK